MKKSKFTHGISPQEKYNSFAVPYNEKAEQDAIWYALNGKHDTIFEYINNKTLFKNSLYAGIYEGIKTCIEKNEYPSPLSILRLGWDLSREYSKEASKIKQQPQPIDDLFTTCMVVIENEVARQVIYKCMETLDSVYNSVSNSITAAETLTNFSDEIGQSLNHISKLDFQDLKRNVIAEIKERVEGNAKVIKTNISELDLILGGFENGSFSVIAARPSMGKTAFLVQLMYNIAVIQNKKVLMFNLEMTKEELCKRFIALHTKFSNFELRQGFDRQMGKYDEMVRRVESLTTNNIYLIDNIFDGNQIFAKARQMVNNVGIELVFFDYIQLSSLKESGNREQEISKISRLCKQTAKQCKIPVIALSQLSRAVESRSGDKRPQMSDIRESGAIEQDADNVLFLYRPEYYEITMDENNESTFNLLEVIIAKARNGVLKTVKLHYERMYNEVTNWSNRGQINSKIIGNISDFESAPKVLGQNEIGF